MATLRIQLLGKFYVRRNEQVLDGFEARKVQELFCYLLLHRDHALPRETLASILWPDTTTVQSKKNLRQALWQLQSALGSHAEHMNDRLLLVEPDWVQLNAEADLWLDVAELEQTFTLVQKIPGQGLDASKAQILHDAAQLYQGPLLEGWYHGWCLFERQRLQSMYLAILDKLMSYCEVRHDYETGLLYGMRIMCYDRARESTHRRLMRLHYLSGDRAAALRQYDQCAAALEEELGVRPSKYTLALYEQIQADLLVEPAVAVAEVVTAHGVPAATLLEALEHLTQLQVVITDLQNEVRQSIQTIQEVLKNHTVPVFCTESVKRETL